MLLLKSTGAGTGPQRTDMSRRRPHRRYRAAWEATDDSIAIRVGSRRSATKYHEVQAAGPRDAGRFARLVEEQTRAHPRDPLVIAVNGYQTWLGEVLASCIKDSWSSIADLDRSVQFGATMQFPEKDNKRGQYVPWTLIIECVSRPEVCRLAPS